MGTAQRLVEQVENWSYLHPFREHISLRELTCSGFPNLIKEGGMSDMREGIMHGQKSLCKIQFNNYQCLRPPYDFKQGASSGESPSSVYNKKEVITVRKMRPAQLSCFIDNDLGSASTAVGIFLYRERVERGRGKSGRSRRRGIHCV